MNNDKNEENKQKIQATNAMVGCGIAVTTASKTNELNSECNAFREALGTKSAENQSSLNDKLKTEPGFVGDRSKGISVAYEYEEPVRMF